MSDRWATLTYTFCWLLGTGACLGVACGLAIVYGAESVEEAVPIARQLWIVLNIVLFAMLLIVLFWRREDWTAAPVSSDPETLGQARAEARGFMIGISISSSLFAGLAFQGCALAVPYLVRSLDVTGLATQLSSSVFYQGAYGILAAIGGVAAVVGGLRILRAPTT